MSEEVILLDEYRKMRKLIPEVSRQGVLAMQCFYDTYRGVEINRITRRLCLEHVEFWLEKNVNFGDLHPERYVRAMAMLIVALHLGALDVLDVSILPAAKGGLNAISVLQAALFGQQTNVAEVMGNTLDLLYRGGDVDDPGGDADSVDVGVGAGGDSSQE